MKLTNVRLSRHRRKKFAARVTVGWTDDGRQIKKYLGTFNTREEVLNALANDNQNPFDVDF